MLSLIFRFIDMSNNASKSNIDLMPQESNATMQNSDIVLIQNITQKLNISQVLKELHTFLIAIHYCIKFKLIITWTFIAMSFHMIN